ncbi:MAG: hypothetical protein AAF600_12745 [Bacteroidota bacterium]
MKASFTFFILCTSIISLFAQEALTTGNRIVGGGISFSQDDAENEFPFVNSLDPTTTASSNSLSYSISPYYGRIYEDFKMLGIRLRFIGRNSEYENVGNTFENQSEISERSIGVGGFLRRYFLYSDRFGVFLDAGIDLVREIYTNESISFNIIDSSNIVIDNFKRENETWRGSIDAEVGIYFFVLNEVSIETTLSRFFLEYSDIKRTIRDFEIDETVEGEGNSTNLGFRFVNNFSFDQIFTINYYF